MFASLPSIKEASIKIKFEYKDFLCIPYGEEYILKTRLENNQFKWTIISDEYYENFKKNKW